MARHQRQALGRGGTRADRGHCRQALTRRAPAGLAKATGTRRKTGARLKGLGGARQGRSGSGPCWWRARLRAAPCEGRARRLQKQPRHQSVDALEVRYPGWCRWQTRHRAGASTVRAVLKMTRRACGGVGLTRRARRTVHRHQLHALRCANLCPSAVAALSKVQRVRDRRQQSHGQHSQHGEPSAAVEMASEGVHRVQV